MLVPAFVTSELKTGFQIGFLIFAGLAILALFGLLGVKTRWRTTWGSSALTLAKV